MQTITFYKCDFKEGINVTIRKSKRWLGKTGKFQIVDGDEVPFGYCEVTKTRAKRFCDLTPQNVKNEHDPECRTLEGLRRTMERIFPNFKETDMVTLVAFKLITEDEFYGYEE